jgi:uncharacterized protein YjbI with pentapeptide repeats
MGLNFPGIDLGGKDLSGFYLADRTFSGADLTGAGLDRANLSGAIDLGSATLDHVKWHPEHPPTWLEDFAPPPNTWPGGD